MAGYLLAQAELTLNAADATARTVAAAWDYTWMQALGGGLYTTLANMGITIAVACLLLWTLSFVRKWMADEVNGIWALEELIWPVVVILLLSNSGANLRLLSQSLRQILNDYNSQILQITANEIRMDRALAELADYNTTQAQIMAAHDQCNTIVEPEKRKTCLDLRSQNVETMVRVYQQQHPGSQIFKNLRRAADAFQDPVNATGKAVSQLVFNPVTAIIQVFLIACQGAFQYLIETAWLLTAMLGPVAVGASLLPFGAKPLYAWITGFISLGFCKICLNIITGLVAIAIYKGYAADEALSGFSTLTNAVFMGLLAPMLAITISTGGGMAVFNALLSASGALAGAAVQGGMALIGSGGGGTALAVTKGLSSGRSRE